MCLLNATRRSLCALTHISVGHATAQFALSKLTVFTTRTSVHPLGGSRRRRPGANLTLRSTALRAVIRSAVRLGQSKGNI